MKSTFNLNSYSISSRTAPASEPYERASSRPLGRPLGRPLTRGRDYRCDVVPAPVFRATTSLVRPPEPQEPEPEKIEPQAFAPEMSQLAGATTRLVPPPEPEEISPEMPRQGLLGNLFSWLRGRAPARKQLRLVETVPLGEKRFVAIIHAQGRKYLVGGGASGVALLTSLDDPASQQASIAPLATPVEVAG
jgi:Flagellar biosynthesis protein, FliO